MAGKYSTYPEYKDSKAEWLGQLPAHWKEVRCKYVYREVEGRSEDGSETLLSVSEYYGVKPRSSVIDEGDFLSRAATLEGYKKCQVDDLVMNIMLAWKTGLGVTKHDGIVSPAYSVFRLIRKCHPDFMHYLLRTPLYTTEFKTKSTGVIDSRLRLYPETFGTVEIVIPPFEEQEQIANFLDHQTAKVDTLIDKQQQLIKLLKEKRQAVISHAVTKGLNPDAPMKDSGVDWLGEVPEHWEVTRLKYISNIIDCKNRTPEYVDGGDYLVCRTSNVKGHKLNLEGALYTDKKNFDIWTQRGIPPVGSILFTREAPAGEVCLVPADLPLCLGQRMMNFIPYEPAHSKFLFDFLTSDCLNRYIESEAAGSTVTHLRVEQVYNIPVVLPPAEEQEEIDKMVSVLKSKYSRVIEHAYASIDLMLERRTALISAAVTGKIDVRNWKPEPSEQPMEATA